MQSRPKGFTQIEKVQGKCVDPSLTEKRKGRATDKLVGNGYLIRFSMVRSKGAQRPKTWQAKARRGRAAAVIFQPLLGRGAPAETGWGENLFDSPLRALIHWCIPYLATCSLFLPL